MTSTALAPAGVQTIDFMILELGVFEKTGANDGVPAEKYMRGDKLAWCAGLVLFGNEQSRKKTGGDVDITPDDWTYYALRSVKTMVAHFKRFDAFVERVGYTPKRNDIIFFGHTVSDVGVQGNHVGVVEFVKDGWVHTVEGNTSNKVARRKYKLDDKTILGYGLIDKMPANATALKPAKK